MPSRVEVLGRRSSQLNLRDIEDLDYKRDWGFVTSRCYRWGGSSVEFLFISFCVSTAFALLFIGHLTVDTIQEFDPARCAPTACASMAGHHMALLYQCCANQAIPSAMALVIYPFVRSCIHQAAKGTHTSTAARRTHAPTPAIMLAISSHPHPLH